MIFFELAINGSVELAVVGDLAAGDLGGNGPQDAADKSVGGAGMEAEAFGV